MKVIRNNLRVDQGVSAVKKCDTETHIALGAKTDCTAAGRGCRKRGWNRDRVPVVPVCWPCRMKNSDSLP